MTKIFPKKCLYIVCSFLIIAGFLVAVLSGRTTKTAETAVSILFVGNSHVRTGNVPAQLQAIARLHGINITYRDISSIGADLSDSKDRAIREIQNGNFDYVVLQDSNRRVLADIEGFSEDIRTLSNVARENGAMPVLYNHRITLNIQPNEEIQTAITQAYMAAEYENNAILINAADAIISAQQNFPQLSLYARDGWHLNHAGAFLTAIVFATELFDVSLENMPVATIFDNLQMEYLIIFGFFVSFVVAVVLGISRISKKSCVSAVLAVVYFGIFYVIGMFPHIFTFIVNNRLVGIWLVWFVLAVAAYHVVRERSQYFLVFIVAFALTLIPALDLNLWLYRGGDMGLILGYFVG